MKRILAFAALAASLAACTKVANDDQSGGRHSWTQAGILRIAIQSDVKGLALPRSVIDKIYFANARRVFRVPEQR